jgi:hypothetical protein
LQAQVAAGAMSYHIHQKPYVGHEKFDSNDRITDNRLLFAVVVNIIFTAFFVVCCCIQGQHRQQQVMQMTLSSMEILQ